MTKGQISKAKLHMDVAIMLFRRLQAYYLPTQYLYVSWDSSVQFGRDYENITALLPGPDLGARSGGEGGNHFAQTFTSDLMLKAPGPGAFMRMST